MRSSEQTLRTGVVLLTMVAVVAVLHFAEDVLMPVALAVMLAFLLTPVASRLERWGANRPVSVALTTVVVFALLGALIYVAASQFLSLVSDLPSYRDNLLEKVKSLSVGSSGNGLERGIETVEELSAELQKAAPGQPDAPDITRVQIVEPPPNVAQVMRGVFGPLIAPVTTGAIVIVFVVFMLLQREDLRDRLVRLLGAGAMHATVAAIDDAAQRVSRYLLMQTLINAIQGSIVAAGLWLIGVPDALLWGALTVVLRFIPYLGPVLAAAGPIAVSLAVFPGWNEALMVAGMIGVLELVNNNVLEPRLYGSSVGVSSFALIVATVFWTWLWGTAGLFLATPLTVCLAVMGRHIPQLEFVSVILGDEPALEPRERFYQRLLASDTDEAGELVDDAVRSGSALDAFDTMVVPALRFAEHDHERRAIGDDRRDAVIAQVATLVDDMGGSPAAAPAADARAPDAAGSPPRTTVLCLAAADAADELVARMLAHVLPPGDFEGEVLGEATLKSEMIDHVARTAPDVVVISAMPPAALSHARYLCKRLRGRFADVPVVVGLWDAQGDRGKAVDRLVAVGATKVVHRLSDALDELTALRQPLLQGVQRPERPAGAAAVDACAEH